MPLTWVEISKSRLKNNLQQFRQLIGKQRKLMVIVKSNAYGHGILEVSKICLKEGADWLGVANLNEALWLRANKISAPIFILSYYPLERLKIKAGVRQEVDFPVYNLEQITFLDQIGQELKKKINVHLKVDTGASRIGVQGSREALALSKKIKDSDFLNLRGIFTHYADSESEDQSYADQQTKKFQEIIQTKEAPFSHAACSAAIINTQNSLFNMVRLGIALYGLWPSNYTRQRAAQLSLFLKPVLSWWTKVIQVKELKAGTSIGYDRTFVTKKKTKIAVLPVGYADGYDRHLSNQGVVIVKGVSCPVRGRVCMNLIMVDVSQVKEIKAGDKALLLAGEENTLANAEDWAQKIGTINYEVVTRINQDIPRVYK
ncbi:alanine racemase [Patescibacteria group bacterium]|nr:alanine racemase [Patescibacteria group bacterium]